MNKLKQIMSGIACIAITLLFVIFGSLGAYNPEDAGEQYEVVYATNNSIIPNEPIGQAKGIFPGRVVWVHNPDATNENCVPDDTTHPWFAPENNNQEVIDDMVSKALQALTGQTTDGAAWDTIFKYHNSTRGKGSVGYSLGENIFIKINVVSSWSGNYNSSDLSKVKKSWGGLNPNYAVTETSPAVVLSVLRQLVNVVGVPQSNIYVGDPLRHIFKEYYDILHSEFPNVHYLDYSYNTLGREKVVKSSNAIIYYSDHGTILRPDVWDPNRPGGTTPIYHDTLYTIHEIADYVINLPVLKGHRRAGMTMFAKNNFGSHTRADASHLHNGLVAPMEMQNGVTRGGYGWYRVQVDIMAHSLLGKKNLLYLMDALWTTDYELDKPLKWQMEPFNNDYMSSIFASLDPVAIESVGYDFLRSEFTAERTPPAGTYVQMEGVDDYLHQAADSSNWPDGIVYDPDSTGTLFASLGVHEHWNNPTDKQYTRNLGTGSGIELYKVTSGTIVYEQQKSQPVSFELYQNYPNPFNSTTTIRYYLPSYERVRIKVYNITGQEIATLIDGTIGPGYHEVKWNVEDMSSGLYIYRMTAGKFTQAKTLVYVK